MLSKYTNILVGVVLIFALTIPSSAQAAPAEQDGSRLMCEAHGATFNLQDGSCDNGPCQGDTLAKIPFETVNEAVRIRKQLAPQ